MKNIAFCGWAGSGKTEAAQYLRDTYGYNIISFADGIKKIDKELFDTKTKDRERLQKIGEFFRLLDEGVWVKHTEKRILKPCAVDDLRRINEYEMLLRNNFVIVRVVADEDKRIERLMNRDGQCDVSLLYNESESGTKDLDVIEIENNGSYLDFYTKLDKLTIQHLV